MPASLAQSSAREWFLFTLGVKRNEDIVAWADSVILLEPKPDIRVIELATTTPTRTDVFMAELDRLRDGADVWQAVEDGLGAVYDYLRVRPQEASRIAGALYNFTNWYSDTMPDQFSFIHRFDDAFALAEDGSYGRVEDVTSEFLSQLKKYKKEANQASEPTSGLKPGRGSL